MTGVLIFLFIVLIGDCYSQRFRANAARRAANNCAGNHFLPSGGTSWNGTSRSTIICPSPLKEQLHGLINIFLAEKNIEGAAGLEMTDEIRVTIAGQACILLLNRETDYYPRLYSIVVYPHSVRG